MTTTQTLAVTVKVKRDPDPESPRSWDNLGTMACWHRRYRLGDVQPKQDPEEWLAENAPEGSVVLPLYLYDHGGITMRTGPFSCPWDSGRVGYIVASVDKIRKEYSVDEITDLRVKVEEVLRAEVSVYDDFLTGNVWGYSIDATYPCDGCGSLVHEHEHEDSCWGFFGNDALEAMKEHVAGKYHAALEAAWEDRQ